MARKVKEVKEVPQEEVQEVQEVNVVEETVKETPSLVTWRKKVGKYHLRGGQVITAGMTVQDTPEKFKNDKTWEIVE